MMISTLLLCQEISYHGDLFEIESYPSTEAMLIFPCSEVSRPFWLLEIEMKEENGNFLWGMIPNVL